MNKAVMDQSWDYFRTVNGIGLRAIAALPADKLDAHPIPNMRTPKELIVHMYTSVTTLPAAVVQGEIKDETETENATAARIKTKDELVQWARAQWAEAAGTAKSLTDAQLNGMVKSPWGHDFKGHVMMQILFDEYWHHRGQLYCYLRALGIEPPSLYDFEGNEAGFEQKQQASA
jgi:uncharacterized damage-inducible protein DinB